MKPPKINVSDKGSNIKYFKKSNMSHVCICLPKQYKNKSSLKQGKKNPVR